MAHAHTHTHSHTHTRTHNHFDNRDTLQHITHTTNAHARARAQNITMSSQQQSQICFDITTNLAQMTIAHVTNEIEIAQEPIAQMIVAQ